MKKRILSLLLVFVMVLGMLPIAGFAADVPFSVTADGETAELSYVGEFTNRQYGNSQIPVYLAQVSESAKISVPYESGYRTFGSNYFSEADLVDMTKDTLQPYFTTASNYGLTTENDVAYVELRDSKFNSVYGVLIELIPESDGGDTDTGESGTTAAVTVTVDGTAVEVTSLGNQTYSDGYAYDPSMVTVPFFTVKVNEGSDFVIDGSAVGTVNAFHVSSGASLYGTHPYTMTAATLEAYFLMSADDFNARFTFEHGLNTENKVAFIEARNSGDRVYCLLVELIPDAGDSGSGDSETTTAPVSLAADGTEVSVTAQGAFADKQYWGASQIPVYYAKVSEDAAISITYSEDYLALGSDYFSSLDPSALTGITKTDLEAYFVTASDYGLDTANSVAYIEFATNDGYYTSSFGLLIELEPNNEPEPDPEPVVAPVSVTADGTAVSVTTQGSFANKMYNGSSYIPVYYAMVSDTAVLDITYDAAYSALDDIYLFSIDPSELMGITGTDLEAYFTTASDYGLDTANSVAYIEFANGFDPAFGLLIELEGCAHATYTAAVTAPTCTEGGYTTYTCVQCGHTYTADETEALGHSYVAGVCTVCGAEDPDYVPATVTVSFSLSDDADFLVGDATGEVMALKEITVPYFDLALYGMESFYFSSESYGDDGDGQPGSDLAPGTPEYAEGKITMMHLFIYATEVYYCGVDVSEAGQGYLYEEGLMPGDVLDIGGSQGSSFINYIWGMDMNLNYYLNYEYPLASEGWGATSDQILLEDGDIVTLGHFSSWSFFNDSTSIFNYIVSDNDAPTQGDEITLTLYHAGADFSGNYTTAHSVIDYCPEVFYAPVDSIPSGTVSADSGWISLGYAEPDGTIIVDTADLAPGEYIIAIAGQYGAENPSEICSTPGGMRLVVAGSAYALGDVNMDGVIDTQDANLVVSAYYGTEDLTDEQIKLADVDGNGIIDTQDANLIVSYFYGDIESFPAEG